MAANKIIVTYRRTSRLSMRIGRKGEVRVSAPYNIGQKEVERFVFDHQDWIENATKRMLERQAQRQTFYNQLPLNTRQEKLAAKERLKTILLPLVEKYSTEMGLSVSALSLTATTSKWGSCQVQKKRLQFSLYLLLLPLWCIEHIVVHELAHLIVPNHSQKFYAVMDRYFPLWREAQSETKRIRRMQ